MQDTTKTYLPAMTYAIFFVANLVIGLSNATYKGFDTIEKTEET